MSIYFDPSLTTFILLLLYISFFYDSFQNKRLFDTNQSAFRRRGPLISLKKVRICTPLYAINKANPKMVIVTGIAISQNIPCPRFMFLISVVFIPKKLVTNDNGRKIIVTIVKTNIAFPLSSCLSSTS